MSEWISPEQMAVWDRDGYLKVEGLLSPAEAAEVSAWVDEVAAWPDSDDKWIHHREDTEHGVRLSRSENFMPFHEGLKKLLTSGKILESVSQVMGEPAVLYKEKINYKYPGGGGYAAHQDAPAYEFIKKHVTCLIAIDANTPENGCLFFCPGRHKEGFIGLDDVGCITPEVAETLEWHATPTEPGDVLFFSSYAPHKSPPNNSNQSRRALYLTYNAAAEGDLRSAYYEDKRATFAAHSGSGTEAEGRISKIGHFQGKTVLEK
ncbi:MAG: phytanoyl-CoA dioxygenase family protein [Planctomycetota bacterium]|nr:MAG: phytanoyl-CoA dioxygenase family protein [Planctomycetota bacterium]REJ91510.1 MAG: phytanoyl-CoA dioxygenase family protein [Planctomycetota bacterium]REK26944.1 MAG: phytanoyl-CoA dioxygenase family protein [Planctomycetota bacterium]REK44379.1 MAG: phytanoyl-CoA dioxygenase family protein [Planctomycetota bacterium]